MNTATHSAEDVAVDLGCAPRWIKEQAREGKIPARRIAGQWRFTDSDVEEIIALFANGYRRPDIESTTPGSGLTQQSRLRLRASNPLTDVQDLRAQLSERGKP